MIYEYCLWDIMIAIAYTSVLWVAIFMILIYFLFKKRNRKINYEEYDRLKIPPPKNDPSNIL